MDAKIFIRRSAPLVVLVVVTGLGACSSAPERSQDHDDAIALTASAPERRDSRRSERDAAPAFPRFKPVSLETAPAEDRDGIRAHEHSGLSLAAILGGLALLALVIFLIRRIFRGVRGSRIEIDPHAEVVLLNGRFVEGTDEAKREGILLGLGSRGVKDLASVATVLREPSGNLVVLHRT